MIEFDAVILAAGLSRRMSAENKLLLDWYGRPLIAHVAQACLAAVDGPVTIVTGHEADRIAVALDSLPVTLRYNTNYESGQQSSVAAALRQRSVAKATLLGPGDQPFLQAHDLRWLMAIHHALDPDRVTVPFNGGIRGNPIIIPAPLRAQMQENPRNAACRRFTRDNPALVSKAVGAAAAFFADIDTGDDCAAFIAQTGAPYEVAS